jgi:DNA mismatch endonuclease (patch repair protein)
MRRIRKKDTRPEMAVRRAAHALGLRFRLYRRDLPGSPDLVFPRHGKLIFVHGCFWHQHPGCKLARQPNSRPEYWLPKLKRNVARDREAQAELLQAGWTVFLIWECETKDPTALRSRIARFFGL